MYYAHIHLARICVSTVVQMFCVIFVLLKFAIPPYIHQKLWRHSIRIALSLIFITKCIALQRLARHSTEENLGSAAIFP